MLRQTLVDELTEDANDLSMRYIVLVKRSNAMTKPKGDIAVCVNVGRFELEFVGETAVLKDPWFAELLIG